MAHTDSLVTTDLFIDGAPRQASNNRVYELYNPARPTQLVGHAAAASITDVQSAVSSAHAAFPGDDWDMAADIPPPDFMTHAEAKEFLDNELLPNAIHVP